jgi:hypothetical protein
MLPQGTLPWIAKSSVLPLSSYPPCGSSGSSSIRLSNQMLWPSNPRRRSTLYLKVMLAH